MPDIYTQRLTEIVKQQAELFLLDAGEFFPFGSYINKSGNVIPISAYVKDHNDRPSSLDLITVLEKFTIAKLAEGECIVRVIAIDVFIKNNDHTYNALELRFYHHLNHYKIYLSYVIHKSYVEFLNIDER